MNKIFEMIKSGRAFERILDEVIAAIPAIIIAIGLVVFYIVATKKFEQNNQPEKAQKIRGLVAWMYLGFLAFIYLSPIGMLDERVFDPSFKFTVGQAFHFIKDIILFAPLATLLHFSKKNYFLTFGVPVGASIFFELFQYITKFGTATIRNTVAAIIGALVGFGVAVIIELNKQVDKELS